MSRKTGKLRGRLQIERQQIEKLRRENLRLHQTRAELIQKIENFEMLKRVEAVWLNPLTERAYGVRVRISENEVREIRRIRGTRDNRRDESWWLSEAVLGHLIGFLAKAIRGEGFASGD